MSNKYLDFESNIESLERDLIDIKKKNLNPDNIQNKINKAYESTYSKLSPWQKVQIARHPERPHTLDYINGLFSDLIFLSGDKRFAEDSAIISGLGKIEDISALVIGTEKGNSTETRIKHNFGMAKPEGYRKVQRLFQLANRFQLPIITFVDTSGAYPGKEAEERGQAEAIANSILESLKVSTPIVSIIIGEGGSGGAVALATADRVLMLENSIYSVISPEGCASILWRDPGHVKLAAESLKLTAFNCKEYGVVDDIIPELSGGAHRNKDATIKSVGEYIIKNLRELINMSKENLVKNRNDKYINITSNIS